MIKVVIPIYNLPVYYMDSRDDGLRFVTEHDKDKDTSLVTRTEGLGGAVIDSNDDAWRFLGVWNGDMAILIHEACHLAHEMLCEMDIRHSAGDDVFTYLVAHLVEDYANHFPIIRLSWARKKRIK